MSAFLWVGLLVVAIGTIATVLCMPEKSKKVWWVVLILIGAVMLIIGASKIGEEDAMKQLAKETKLEEVFVKGQTNFWAQIQIIYKDGELDSVKLVPNTTKK